MRAPCAAPRPALRSVARAALLVAALAATSAAQAQVPGSGSPPGRPEPQRPAPAPTPSASPAEERWQARFQTTYVRQNKPSFRADYSGPNSLSPERERSYSLTATLMLGARPWRGGEVYLNPEMALGLPLSQLTGLGGFPNAELARTAGRDPVFYLARLFVRQTWALGGEAQRVEPDQNQLAGSISSRRVVATVGLLPVIDLFDDNAYNHDGRTQFMNWSIVTHAAYDFAADARGYSRGAALEWFHDDWALRIARFAMPSESNGGKQNLALGHSYGDQIEVERGWHLGADKPGRLRLLAFRNRAQTGSFADALALAAATGATPDVAAVRRDQVKAGYGVNVEQSLGRLGGAFLRASRNDGRTETFAYTEVDRSVSGGVLFSGAAWGRSRDSAGLAFARNGLSASHRDYLAAGGLGFFLGDGRLNYRAETIFEALYAFSLAPRAWASFDAQRIVHPAYNADRGPVNVFSLRTRIAF